jgi:hypothetical protein
MTDGLSRAASDEAAPRRARLRTTHVEAGAETVAAAVRPDNAPSMTTRVDADGDADVVVTTIERDRTGGLAASVDDYVVNVTVADRVARCALDVGRGVDDRDTDELDDTDADATDELDDTDADADTDTDANADADADADADTNTDDTHQP